MLTMRRWRRALMLALLMTPVAVPAWAWQLPADALPSQSLRAYWHVFIAYAIVILLVIGYVVWMARRLSALEARLADADGGSGA